MDIYEVERASLPGTLRGVCVFWPTSDDSNIYLTPGRKLVAADAWEKPQFRCVRRSEGRGSPNSRLWARFLQQKRAFFFLFVLWVDVNKINKVYMVFFVFLESLLLAFKEDNIIQMVYWSGGIFWQLKNSRWPQGLPQCRKKTSLKRCQHI